MRAFLQPFAGNWKLKLTALGLAMLLWVALSAEQVTTRWLTVPVNVQVQDAGYQLSDVPDPETVEVRFAGSGRDLLELAIQRPVLILSVAEVQDPTDIYTLSPQMVNVPAAVNVAPQDVRPNLVRVEFTEVTTKEVPVRVVVTGRPEGARVLADTLRVRPRTVRIRGPAELLQRIDAVRTRPLDLSVEDSSFARAVPLDTDATPGVRFGTPDVEVSGDVVPAVLKTLPNVPVRTSAGFISNPPMVEVTLRGPAGLVDPLDARSLLVGAAAGTLPQVLPAEGLLIPLGIEGVPDGVQVEVQPRSVRIAPIPEPAPPAAPPS